MSFMSVRDQDSACIHGHSGWQDLRHMCSGILGHDPCILGSRENVPVFAVSVMDEEKPRARALDETSEAPHQPLWNMNTPERGKGYKKM